MHFVGYDGTLLSKKSVEDFTLLFKINNVLVVVEYRRNTWYFFVIKIILLNNFTK